MHLEFDVPTTIIGLAIAFLCAWIAARMARKRHRETLLWAALGFFFPCVTFIVLLIIGDAQPRKR